MFRLLSSNGIDHRMNHLCDYHALRRWTSTRAYALATGGPVRVNRLHFFGGKRLNVRAICIHEMNLFEPVLD